MIDEPWRSILLVLLGFFGGMGLSLSLSWLGERWRKQGHKPYGQYSKAEIEEKENPLPPPVPRHKKEK